jgi:hypothetical protein
VQAGGYNSFSKLSISRLLEADELIRDVFQAVRTPSWVREAGGSGPVGLLVSPNSFNQ